MTHGDRLIHQNTTLLVAASLGLFLAFFFLLLNLSLLVEDLLRFSVADEKNNRGKDQDDGSPSGSITKSKLINSGTSIIFILIIWNAIIIVISIICKITGKFDGIDDGSE